MLRRITFGKALFALGAVALVVAAILPTTGWLVRLQTQSLVTLPEAWRLAEEDMGRRFALRERLALAQNPNDFEMHLASAIRLPFYSSSDEGKKDDAKTVTRLVALQTKWGGIPALPAAVLRTMTPALVAVNRDYLENLTSNYKNAAAPKSDAPKLIRDDERIGRNSPANLALFRENAERGERLDPDNGYFPALLAIALFAERRDVEARAALRRAAAAKRWEDYVTAEIQGQLSLSHAVYGRSGFVHDLSLKSGVQNPQFTVMRSLARAAIGQAIARERAGDVATGFELRRSVAHVGALLRETSSDIVGASLGISLIRMASTYPGGVITPYDKSLKSKERDERKFAAYHDYLVRIGHADEAEWLQKQREAGRKTQTLFNSTFDKTIYDVSRYGGLALGYAASWLTFLNAFWMIVFGGVAALTLRRKWGVSPAPVAFPIRLGVGAVFANLLFIASCAATDAVFAPFAVSDESAASDGGEAFYTRLIASFAALSLILCILLLVRFARRTAGNGRFWSDLGRFGLSMGATVALIAAVFWPAYQLFVLVNNIRYDYFMATEFNPLTHFGALAAAFVVSALMPLGIGLYGIGVGLYRREAVVSCIARAFRKTALPAAGVLLLLYMGALVATTALENRSSAELQYAIQNERQYLWEIARRP